jgi:hypothetical protein
MCESNTRCDRRLSNRKKLTPNDKFSVIFKGNNLLEMCNINILPLDKGVMVDYGVIIYHNIASMSSVFFIILNALWFLCLFCLLLLHYLCDFFFFCVFANFFWLWKSLIIIHVINIKINNIKAKSEYQELSIVIWYSNGQCFFTLKW